MSDETSKNINFRGHKGGWRKGAYAGMMIRGRGVVSVVLCALRRENDRS